MIASAWVVRTYVFVVLIFSRRVWLFVSVPGGSDVGSRGKLSPAATSCPSLAPGNPWSRREAALCYECTWIKLLCVVFLRSLWGWKGPYPPPRAPPPRLTTPPPPAPGVLLWLQSCLVFFEVVYRAQLEQQSVFTQCFSTYAADQPHRWTEMQQQQQRTCRSGCCPATSVLNEAQGQGQSEYRGVLLLQWLICRCMQTEAQVVICVRACLGFLPAAPRLSFEYLIIVLCLKANCTVFFLT